MKSFTKQLLFTVTALLLIGKINAQCSPPVYFGMMIHLEDDWDDNTNVANFNNHALQLRMAVEFVKPYGAKFTAECAIPFAEGCTNWGDNVLQSLIDSTMGVGSHSDKSSNYAYTKLLVDGLVGTSENRGVSGGWGGMDAVLPNNWADSANNVGLLYLNAPVYFCYLQIPQNERPDSVSNTVILDSLYHSPAPKDFNERVHPHRINSAFTWHIDTTGPVVFLTGSLGEISSIAEGRENCYPTCILDSADVDTILAYVNQAVNIAQTTNKFTVVYMHTPLYTYLPDTKHIYQYLFESLAPLVTAGDLEYKTMGEIYDSFIQCELISSVEDNTFEKSDIKLYPNPTTGVFTVEGGNLSAGQASIQSVEILNINGQTIYSSNDLKSSYKFQLDLSNQPKGIYFVKIQSKNYINVKKIIKN